MKKQNYSNHVRYYIPHHFMFLPLTTLLMVIGIRNAITYKSHQLEWALFSIVCFLIFYLAIMLRQHYALGNQDRIVRLEFRLRYFELKGETAQQIEKQLSFSQIAALRFANDDEFTVLLDRAIKENLDASQIKKSIRNWQADYMRL